MSTPSTPGSVPMSGISPGTILPVPSLHRRQSSQDSLHRSHNSLHRSSMDAPSTYLAPMLKRERSRTNSIVSTPPNTAASEPAATQSADCPPSEPPAADLEPRNSDQSSEMEIDFTTGFAGTSSLDGQVQCGFCTNESYCMCKMLEMGPAAPQLDQPSTPPVVRDTSVKGQALPTLEPFATATGPGSCDSCMRDPHRRQMCIDISNRSMQVARSPKALAPIRELDEEDEREKGETESTTSFVPCTKALDMAQEGIPNFSRRWPQLVQDLRTASPAETPCTDCRTGRGSAGHTHQDVQVASILELMRTDSRDSGSFSVTRDSGSFSISRHQGQRDSGYGSLDSDMMDDATGLHGG